MRVSRLPGIVLGLLATFSVYSTTAAEQTAAMFADEIIFTAPPKETPRAGRERYGPVAEYLSQVLGRRVTYKHPGNWTIFRIHMLKGNYDLIFDDGHLNNYRSEKLGHNTIVKAAAPNRYVVIVKKNSVRYQTLQNLTGRTICSQAPPDLATIIVLNRFSNPARQPLIRNTESWPDIYRNVITGKCAAGILPLAALDQFEKQQSNTRVVFLTRPLPNLAFSAGPRLSKQEQIKIARALTAKEGRTPTAKLRDAFMVQNGFVPASNQEYTGLAKYLENQLGY
ncbi:MAG: hypothetical protein BMS9Abin33_1130 [Gammaproteobacteria bacterium]|nr:MAG: hypothetical protein BMS9Abin33_1130 [Gammaproteobacteria bacterium]